MSTYFNEDSIFMQQLIDTIPNPIFYKDVKGVFRFCNTAFVEYVGLSKQQIINHTVYDISPKELADIYTDADNELFNLKGKKYYEAKVQHIDGTVHDVYFIIAAMLDKNEKVEGLVGTMVDITERKKTENKVNRLLKLKEAMLEVNHAIMKIEDISELFNLILEKAISSMDNATIGSILLLDENNILRIVAYRGLDPEKVEQFSMKLEDSFIWSAANGHISKTIIINNIQKLPDIDCEFILENKDIFKILSSISAPIIIDENLYGFINVDSPYNNFFDEGDIELLEYLRYQTEMVISKHQLYEQTVFLSKYDKLTNVYNRRYFEDIIDDIIGKAINNNKQFLLVEFDLNGLKIVNDTYGHLAGDELIKTFASNLNRNISSSDILSRVGGDEFIGIFFDIDNKALTERLESLINNLKENPIIFEGIQIMCNFSYGIASMPEDGIGYNQLLSMADKNMYEYKKNYYKSNR